MAIQKMIQNITSGSTEIGKIKIGRKAESRQGNGGASYRRPTKIDHFLITKMDNDSDENFVVDKELMDTLCSEFADGDGKLRRIPIQLMYDDIELILQSQYNFYNGTKIGCRGDGIEAEERDKDGNWQKKQCPCWRLETGDPKNKCKIAMRLAVHIRYSNRVGGAWYFRSTSIHTLSAIVGSLLDIKRATGGVLAGLPLWMKLIPKIISTPSGRAKAYVVHIEFDGNEDALQQAGYGVLENRNRHQIKMSEIQAEAKKLISAQRTEFTDENGDLTSEGLEFHPEAQEGYETEEQEQQRKQSEAKARSQKVKTSRGKKVVEDAVIEPTNPVPEQVVEEVRLTDLVDENPIEHESNYEEDEIEEEQDWGDF